MFRVCIDLRLSYISAAAPGWRLRSSYAEQFPLPDQPEYSYLSFFFRLQGWPKSISYLLFLVYRHVKPNNQMKYFLWYCLIIDIATCMRYKVFAVPIRMEERCKSIFISFSMGIIKELSHQIFKFWFDYLYYRFYRLQERLASAKSLWHRNT